MDLSTIILLVAILASFVAIGYGGLLIYVIMKHRDGDEAMRRIAKAIPAP